MTAVAATLSRGYTPLTSPTYGQPVVVQDQGTVFGEAAFTYCDGSTIQDIGYVNAPSAGVGRVSSTLKSLIGTVLPSGNLSTSAVNLTWQEVYQYGGYTEPVTPPQPILSQFVAANISTGVITIGTQTNGVLADGINFGVGQVLQVFDTTTWAVNPISALGYVIATGNPVITIGGTPTGGHFTLSLGGQTTANILYSASASTVQTALQALSTVGAGGVTVTGSNGGPYTFAFSAANAVAGWGLTGTNVDFTGGSGYYVAGSFTVTVSATAGGVAGTPTNWDQQSTDVMSLVDNASESLPYAAVGNAVSPQASFPLASLVDIWITLSGGSVTSPVNVTPTVAANTTTVVEVVPLLAASDILNNGNTGEE